MWKGQERTETGSRFRPGSAGRSAHGALMTPTPPTSPARTDSIGNPAKEDGAIAAEGIKGSYESQLAPVNMSEQSNRGQKDG
jgi:hypothetical protein